MTYLEKVEGERKLQLIETLREVTEGKVSQPFILESVALRQVRLTHVVLERRSTSRYLARASPVNLRPSGRRRAT